MRKLREMAGVVLFLFAAGGVSAESDAGVNTSGSGNLQQTIVQWWQGVVELVKRVASDEVGRGMLIINGVVALIILLIVLAVARSNRKQKKAIITAKREVDDAMRQLAADRFAAMTEINQAIDKVHEKCRQAVDKTTRSIDEMKDVGRRSIDEMNKAINGVKAAWSKVQQWEKASQTRYGKIDKTIADATKESVNEIETKVAWELGLLRMWKYAINMTARQEHAKASEVLDQASELWNRIRQEYPGTHEAFNNWGGVLLERAKGADDDEKEKLLEEAIDKLMVSESVKPGAGAYNLACVYSVMEDYELSRDWLESASKAGTLETQKHAMLDEDLRQFWRETWFRNLDWK